MSYPSANIRSGGGRVHARRRRRTHSQRKFRKKHTPYCKVGGGGVQSNADHIG
ncbi:hypothetical protein RHCRD62_30136 [Rhodococcus sp. RD6.2]|nr:hypothetical protein RHCRD62_30136 [Rhodococcus sp. RD6.2]